MPHGPHKLMLDLYETWVNSNYVVTPYGTGALMLEPWWVRDDFMQLSAIDAWHRKEADRKEARKPKR